MVISKNCCNFKVLKIKNLQTIIAMMTEDKVTEIFCITDDFCKVFDAQMEKYTILHCQYPWSFGCILFLS